MARITVEDCLTKETNRFALVQLAAKRTKQLLTGARVLIPDTRGNKQIVTALREIAAGQVQFMTEAEAREAAERERLEREKAAAAAAARQSAAAAAAMAPTIAADSLFSTPAAPVAEPAEVAPAIADEDEKPAGADLNGSNF